MSFLKKKKHLEMSIWCLSSRKDSCCDLVEEEEKQHATKKNEPAFHGAVASLPKPEDLHLDKPDNTEAQENENNILLIPRDRMYLRQNARSIDVDIFTYDEMKLAAKHVRPVQILGEGGFGLVYKGVIDESVRRGYETTQVAIKELNPNGQQGEREWLAELNYLGQLRHPNLVKLIGYCGEDNHRLLVYEYMAGGSLEKHLFTKTCTTLTWDRRMKILVDAARGLAFLHGLERPLIYRDFKSSNILLDADLNAKLSDFGLARAGPIGDQTHVTTRVMGTPGYAAPEYIRTGHLKPACDVYAFGVVLFEMLTGRMAIDKSRPREEHELVPWGRRLLNNRKRLHGILDPKIEGQYCVKTLLKLANLTYRCLSSREMKRPPMSKVVEVLENLIGQDKSREEHLFLYEGRRLTLF